MILYFYSLETMNPHIPITPIQPLPTFDNTCFNFLSFLSCFSEVFYLFSYFGLCWVFIAMCGPSLVGASGGCSSCGGQVSPCDDFSCFRAQAPGVRLQQLWHMGLVAL